MERTCQICSEPIPVARYEANPIVKTCSPACSVDLAKEINRATSRRQRQRQREARKGKRP